MTRRAYDASLPLYAAWSLESPIYTAMIALQVEGNETRVIGSKSWTNTPLHGCFTDCLRLFPWRDVYRVHVIPPDQQRSWAPQFESFDYDFDQAPPMRDTITPTRTLFPTMRIDNVIRPWTDDKPNNQEFIDALNQYAPREEPSHGGFVVSQHHNLARFFSRALEVYASWVSLGNNKTSARGRPVDYSKYDRAVI